MPARNARTIRLDAQSWVMRRPLGTSWALSAPHHRIPSPPLPDPPRPFRRCLWCCHRPWSAIRLLAAFPDEKPGSALRSLSTPVFSPWVPGLFLCGTEEQSPDRCGSNALVMGRVDLERGELGTRSDGSLAVWTHPLRDHVRDMEWLNASAVVAAVGSTLALVQVNTSHPDFLCEVVQLPQFHTDCIRELAINPANTSLVITGGFDGHVFVTDLQQVAAALEGRASSVQNTMYPGDGAAIGSVGWLPGDAQIATATSDAGRLHLFDIRTHLSRPAVVYDTGKTALYGHGFVTPHVAILGFGDGSVQARDTRRTGCIFDGHDAYQAAIGDVRVRSAIGDSSSNFQVLMCGHPGVSVWSCSSACSDLAMLSHHRASGVDFSANPTYKISGDFIPNTNDFAATDSLGNLLVLQLA